MADPIFSLTRVKAALGGDAYKWLNGFFLRAKFDANDNVTGLINPRTGLDAAVVTSTQDAVSGALKVMAEDGGYRSLNVFTPKDNTFEAVQAVSILCASMGGGTIEFDAVVYNFGGNTLTLQSNVHYKGAGVDFHAIGSTFAGGTIFQGDGTAPLLAFNSTAFQSNLSSLSAYYNNGLTNCKVSGIGFNGGSHAIKIGAQDSMGCSDCRFENLVAINQTQWGFSFTNFHICNFFNLRAEGTAVGGILFENDNSINFNHGNSDGLMLATNMETIKSQGIVVRATNASLNQLNFLTMTSFGSAAPNIAVSATTTAGSIDVAVPNASVFAVDMPVWLSVGIAGLSANTGAFVRSINTTLNTITLAAAIGSRPGSATPITFTAAATQTLNSWGFPKIALIGGVGTGVGGQIQSSKFSGLDLELATSALVFEQNTFGVMIESQFTSVNDNFGYWGINANQGYVQAPLGGNRNFDNASWGKEFRGGQHKGLGGVKGAGYSQNFDSAITDSHGVAANIAGGIFNLRSFRNGIFHPADFYINNATNMIGMSRGLVVQQREFASGVNLGATVNSFSVYNYVYNGTAIGTATMPTISSTTSTQNLGLLMNISNPSAFALTLTAAAGQFFGGATGANTLAVPALSSVEVIASQVGATLYWAVT